MGAESGFDGPEERKGARGDSKEGKRGSRPFLSILSNTVTSAITVYIANAALSAAYRYDPFEVPWGVLACLFPTLLLAAIAGALAGGICAFVCKRKPRSFWLPGFCAGLAVSAVIWVWISTW